MRGRSQSMGSQGIVYEFMMFHAGSPQYVEVTFILTANRFYPGLGIRQTCIIRYTDPAIRKANAKGLEYQPCSVERLQVSAIS